MSESKARRFFVIGDPIPGRLETQFEQRQTGLKRHPLTQRLEPIVKTFHIGHGQQLARRRMYAIRAAQQPINGVTRQAGETGRAVASRVFMARMEQPKTKPRVRKTAAAAAA